MGAQVTLRVLPKGLGIRDSSRTSWRAQNDKQSICHSEGTPEESLTRDPCAAAKALATRGRLSPQDDTLLAQNDNRKNEILFFFFGFSDFFIFLKNNFFFLPVNQKLFSAIQLTRDNLQSKRV